MGIAKHHIAWSLCVVLITAPSARGQSPVNIWDIPLTEILIAQNKAGHEDHLTLRNQQFTSAATASFWKRQQNEFRQLSQQIDQRLSSAFIILGDITLVYEVATGFEEMMGEQEKILQLLKRHPYAAPIVLREQERLLRDAWDMFRFVQLMVLSYGDLSKMKASSRQAIYRQLRDQVQVLRTRCHSLHLLLQRIDLAQVLRNTKIGRYVSEDRAVVQRILESMK